MFKRIVSVHILWIATFLSLPTFAKATLVGLVLAAGAEVGKETQGKAASPLTELGSEFHNNIKLLQNRFRIDYEVEEVTMIFFREYGSAPIVLVRPDGSKIFQSSANGEDIFWFDTATYDMISLKKPTPGPWQAVGQIHPDSRVMVISELELHAEPLPNIVFSGEILKQTAYLTNNSEPINYAAFRDVVELTITLASTNNPNFNNFGAKIETVASFEDNGKGMDEVPLDGTFTGQFNLTIADGEWIPIFNVSTPMYSREQIDPPIKLFANPIKVDVELDGGGSGYHKLKVDAMREHVDMSTLLIDGKIRFPNGDIQNFSITDMSSDVREHLIVNYEYGVYRVKLTAYGNTVSGREFILDVPEYTFLSEEPEPEIVATPEEPSSVSANSPDVVEMSSEDEGMSTSTLVSLVIGINLFIIIVGGVLIWWITLDKKLSFQFKKKSTKQSPETETNAGSESEKPPGFFARILKRKVKVVESEMKDTEDKPKQGKEQGFKDLTAP